MISAVWNINIYINDNGLFHRESARLLVFVCLEFVINHDNCLDVCAYTYVMATDRLCYFFSMCNSISHVMKLLRLVIDG